MPDRPGRVRGAAAVGAFAVSACLAARRIGRRATRRGRAERRFGMLVQNSSDVIAVVRADGVIEYVSPSIERITGRGPEERVGRSAFDLIHPEDVDGVRAEFADLLRRPGDTTTGEFRMLHADGDVRRVEVVAANRLGEPDVDGVVINYRDVTERRRAEEARLRLAAIVHSSGDAITSGDLRGTITSWNAGAERLYGHPAAEAVGRPVRVVMRPLDPGVIAGNISRVGRGETVGPFDAVHHDSSGNVLTVSVTLSPIRDPGGEVTGVAAVTRDVAKRREAERALRASEERFRTALENAPLGVALAGLDGYFLRTNRALCEMLGYSEEELLNMTSAEVTHPDDLHKSAVRENLDFEEGPGTREKRYVCKDGRTVWTLSSISLVRDAEGGPSHFVALYQDITERREAEERLEEAERRYRLLVEKVPAVVYLDGVDGDNPALYRSAHVKEVLGYAPEEFLEDPEFWQKLLHPEDRERVLAENERTNRTGEPFKIEYRMIRKDGGVVWLRDEAVLIRDAGGRPLHWQGVFMDITDRRRAEERVRFQAQLLEQVQAGVIATDMNGTVIHWNEHAETLYGWSREEALGRKAGDLVVGPTEVGVAEGIRARLRDEGSWQGEFSVRRRDGSTFPAYVSDSLVRDAEGRAIGLVGVSTDLTERKRAEETLRQSEERYRAVVERTTDGIFLADFATMRIFETNAALRNMLGYTAEELSDMSVYDIVVDERENIDRNARTVLDEKNMLLGERRYRRRDGSLLDVESSVTRIPYAGREVSCCIVRDITARKRAEEEVREANRRLEELAVLKADFTAMVAHELDTPLAVIRGYADMISTGALDAEGQERALARIQSEADVLHALVDDVRTAASVERQDFAVDPRPVPVGDLLGDAAAFARSLPGDREVVVRDGLAGAVRADRYRIGQVLRNLLSNAAKYSPESAPIELRVLPGGPGHVRFEVSDRGSGISPEEAARIFEKFTRGRNEWDRAGLGLGLYLSRRILRAHGGDLTLHAGSEGGSTFGFELEGAG